MITPIIKSIIVSYENWGEEYDDFWITVDADIGPENGMGAETYTFHVTSPKRLGHMVETGEIQLGRGLLIMNEYNYEQVKQRIATLLKGCKRETWKEVSMTVAKYARWEYDE
jgi:hypothetical protein